MAASLVAELAQIDLEHLDTRRPQRPKPAVGERCRKWRYDTLAGSLQDLNLASCGGKGTRLAK
jgi:hypothetical protein